MRIFCLLLKFDVVNVTRFSVVDDSTGVIQCYQWCDEEQQSVLHFCLGQLVMVICRITVFRDDRQIQMDTIGK